MHVILLGHVIKRETLKNFVKTEKISARKGKVRPRKIILDGLKLRNGEISSKELTQHQRLRSVESHRGLGHFVRHVVVID